MTKAKTKTDTPQEVVIPRPEPAFVPWDGTRRSISIALRGNKKKAKTYRNIPSPVADLLEKHEGNISAAARAMGSTHGTFAVLLSDKNTFDDKRQRKVFEALHAVPSQGQADDDGPDQFQLDMAIIQVPSKNYDRVADVVDLLNGRRLFRAQTPVGWLVVYRIKGEEALKKFKRIASRDCTKITCP